MQHYRGKKKSFPDKWLWTRPLFSEENYFPWYEKKIRNTTINFSTFALVLSIAGIMDTSFDLYSDNLAVILEIWTTFIGNTALLS